MNTRHSALAIVLVLLAAGAALAGIVPFVGGGGGGGGPEGDPVAYPVATNALSNAVAAAESAATAFDQATNALALHGWPSTLSTNIYSGADGTTTVEQASGRYIALHCTNSTLLRFDLADYGTNSEHTVSATIWIGYGNSLTFDANTITNSAALSELSTNTWNDLIFRKAHGKSLMWVRE